MSRVLNTVFTLNMNYFIGNSSMKTCYPKIIPLKFPLNLLNLQLFIPGFYVPLKGLIKFTLGPPLEHWLCPL